MSDELVFGFLFFGILLGVTLIALPVVLWTNEWDEIRARKKLDKKEKEALK